MIERTGYMETIQLAALWEQIMKNLEQELSLLTYNTWLKPMVPLSMTETTFEIGTPKKFIKEWVESRYFSIIQNTVQNVTKKPLALISK
jgi:chromosomal replication initiator protein